MTVDVASHQRYETEQPRIGAGWEPMLSRRALQSGRVTPDVLSKNTYLLWIQDKRKWAIAKRGVLTCPDELGYRRRAVVMGGLHFIDAISETVRTSMR